MWSKCRRLILSILTLSIVVKCDVKLSNFNENLRDYSSDNDATHPDNVRTLQSVESARHAQLSPIKNSITFQDTRDSALASSNNIKGSAPNSKSEYTLHDYEEHPPYGYGPQFYAHDLIPHGGDYHGHRYHGVDHHHRHYGYGLEKAILWPIAGLALLGAAAALVTNPILLQLGVVSGKKRRRRDTEEDTSLDLDEPLYDKQDNLQGDIIAEPKVATSKTDRNKLKKRVFKKHSISKRRRDVVPSLESNDPYNFKKKYDHGALTFVPIPLRFNN